jgi:putative transposase
MIVLEFKLVGAARQYAALDEAIRTTQFVRNKCVRKWCDERGVKPYDLNKYCAVLAKEYDFAGKLNSQARQAAAERAAAAINRFYDKCRAKTPGPKGYPQFVRDGRSVEYKTTGWRLDAARRVLTFTDGFKAGTFKLKGTRDLLGYALDQIKRVRVVKRADGYYSQFCIDAARRVVAAATGRTVGIDLGLSHFYTDSEGVTVENPRHLRRSERALQRLHRRVSSKVKGSKNLAKARGRLARKHLKVSRQRRDFAVKTARALVMSNDVIAYEDLRVSNMVKNRRLAKSIADAGWRAFVTWLGYLAHVYGKVVVAVQPAYTSQDCSGCGERVTKTLSERTHVCPRCTTVLDRDHNAARNILALGLRHLEETTAGHAERNAWGQSALYLSGVSSIDTAAG